MGEIISIVAIVIILVAFITSVGLWVFWGLYRLCEITYNRYKAIKKRIIGE